MCFSPLSVRILCFLGVCCLRYSPAQSQLPLPVYTVRFDSIDPSLSPHEVQVALVPHNASWETVTQASYISYSELKDTVRWYQRTSTDICMRFGVYNPTHDTVRVWWWFCNADNIIYYLGRSVQGHLSLSDKVVYPHWRSDKLEWFYLDLVVPPGDTTICYALYPYYRYNAKDEGILFYAHSQVNEILKQDRLGCLPMVISSVAVLSILLFVGFFFGFHYIYMRSTVHGWYILYVTSMILFFMYHLERVLRIRILFAGCPILLSFSEGIFIAAASFAYLGFMRTFFEMHLMPKRDRWLRLAMQFSLVIFGILLFTEVFFYWENYAGLVFDFSEALVSVLQLACIPLFVRGKKTFAEKIVLLGVAVLILGTGFSVLVPYSVRYEWFKENHLIAMKIGTMIEIVFFSLALVIKSRDDLMKSQQIRERIARDLHDEIGSTLGSISILTETSTPTKTHAQNHLQIIGQRTREVIESMEDIVWSVNPRNDSLTSAVDRLKNYGVEVLESQDVHLHFEVLPATLELTLPMEARKEFLLIAKEALHNAAKYAHARDVWVELQHYDRELHLAVRDNGIGFDLQTIKSGNGLPNMRARAERLNGKLNIISETGVGTQIVLAFSLP